MLGSDLRYLSEVADLARTDFEASALTLASVGHTLVARYQGSYSGGQRWRDLDTDYGLACTVGTMQFKQLVGLFGDDEEVALKQNDKELIITSTKKKRVTLRFKGAPLGIEPFAPIETGGSVVLLADVDDMMKEVAIAAEFTARSMAAPVLTGMLLRGKNNVLGVQSSDGSSSIYEARLNVEVAGEISIVAPAYDLLLGLKLVKDGTVAIIKHPDKKGFDIYGQNAQMHCAEVQGEWPTPAIARARAKVPRQEPIEIDASTIKALTTAVRVLGTRNDLRFRGDGTTMFLETIDAESGDFIAEVPSTVEGTWVFDVNNILLAQQLGSPVNLSLPVTFPHPTLVTAGSRSYWIASKSY